MAYFFEAIERCYCLANERIEMLIGRVGIYGLLFLLIIYSNGWAVLLAGGRGGMVWNYIWKTNIYLLACI